MEIDELEGMELAAAVAEARGWHKHKDASRYAAWFWVDGKGTDQTAVAYYRPHEHIWKAWELLDDFIYSIDNYEWHEELNDAPVGCYLRSGSGAWLAHGQIATEAICRAFLKAKAAL